MKKLKQLSLLIFVLSLNYCGSSIDLIVQVRDSETSDPAMVQVDLKDDNEVSIMIEEFENAVWLGKIKSPKEYCSYIVTVFESDKYYKQYTKFDSDFFNENDTLKIFVDPKSNIVIKGTVLYPNNDKVKNATVHIEAMGLVGKYSVETNEYGQYKILIPRKKRFKEAASIFVIKPGFENLSSSVNIKRNQTNEVNFGLIKEKKPKEDTRKTVKPI